MAITFELDTRLADDSITYKDGKISVHKKMDVRDFITGPLNDDNIDDAIEAARAAAHVELGSQSNFWCYDVYVPEGKYFLTNRHDFPGTGTGAPTPGLACAGPNKTVFRVNSDNGEWVFTFGDATPSATSYANRLNVKGFSIVGNGATAIRSGIKFNSTYRARVEDISISGFAREQQFDKGYGFYFADPTGGDQHQHLHMQNCAAQEVLVGYYLHRVYQGNVRDCSSHGNYFQSIVVDNCLSLDWHSDDLQYGGYAAGSEWHSGRIAVDAHIVTGWSYTTGLGSGSGATCGAASGGFCTVTGLSGLHVFRDRGRWLELQPTGASDANKETVRGLYKIEQVLSATSCIIRKGSTHTSQASCDWQVRGHSGGSQVRFTGGYDEGSKFAQFGFYRDEVTASNYSIEGAALNNSTYYMDVDGVSGTVHTRNVTGAGKVRLRKVTAARIDEDLSNIVYDDHSYAGLICRANRQQLTLGGALHDSGGGRSLRCRDLVKELGSFAAYDLRLSANRTLGAGTDLNSVTDFINGIVMNHENAAAKPQFVAADPTLGACLQVTAGAGTRGMLATATAAVLPDFAFTGSVFAVLRLDSAADPGANTATSITMFDTGGKMYTMLGLHDDSGSPDPWYGILWDGVGNAIATFGATAADTDPHALIVTGMGDVDNLGVHLASDFQTKEYVNGSSYPNVRDPSFTVGGNVTLHIAPAYAANTRSFYVAFVAFFARALTEAECRQLVNAARNEWPLTK